MAISKTVEEAITELGNQIRGTPLFVDYLKHRNRYRNDVVLVQKYASRGSLLEVGSAPCHTTVLLNLLDRQVTGIDLNPERCRELIMRYGLEVHACDIEREYLPFEDMSFSSILFSETLEHLRIDPLFVLSEINRVLRNNGVLLLTTPNLYSAQNIARFILGRGITDAYSEFSKLRRLGHMGHIHEYSNSELCRLLQASGFQVASVRYEHYYYPPGKRGISMRFAFAVLPQKFRSYQVIVARKIASSPKLVPLR